MGLGAAWAFTVAVVHYANVWHGGFEMPWTWWTRLSSSETAAWVQALGTLFAIVAALYAAVRQQRLSNQTHTAIEERSRIDENRRFRVTRRDIERERRRLADRESIKIRKELLRLIYLRSFDLGEVVSKVNLILNACRQVPFKPGDFLYETKRWELPEVERLAMDAPLAMGLSKEAYTDYMALIWKLRHIEASVKRMRSKAHSSIIKLYPTLAALAEEAMNVAARLEDEFSRIQATHEVGIRRPGMAT